MLGGTRVKVCRPAGSAGDYSSIAICWTNRDILRDMWNVSRYFKIYVYSAISSGTLTVQWNPRWETRCRAMSLLL